MARDPLEALLQVRRIALDEARRVLAACLAEEGAASDARAQAEAAIARERDVAERPGSDDAAVEAFAAWLSTGREKVEQATRHSERSAAETARARAAVNVARGAHEAAQEAMARKKELARLQQQQQDQRGFDEAASRTSRIARSDPRGC